MPLQIRRGTNSERSSASSVIPQEGELIYITDTQQLFVGDGLTSLDELSPITGYNNDAARDTVGSMLVTGPNTGITFTYNSGSNTINADINPTQSLTTLSVSGTTTLSNTNISGNLVVTGGIDGDFQGSIVADDSTMLVDAVDKKINLDGTVKGDIIPSESGVYDVGSSSFRFKDMYLTGTSLYLGSAQITASGSAINLPVGSTVGGVSIGNPIGDLVGSVFADNSTLLVDGVSATIVGDVENDTTTSSDINGGVVVLSGVGTTGQKAGLKIITDGNADDNYDLITINCAQNNVTGPAMVFERGRGTPSAPTTITSGDEIMSWTFFAYDTANSSELAAAIQVTSEGTIGAGIIPAKVEIFTTNSSGTPTLGLGISSSQLLSVAGNTVAANSGSGTADVAGGVSTYLKINIGGTEYAIPAYALVP